MTGSRMLPLGRIAIATLVFAVCALLAVIWYFWPQPYDSIRHADRLTVYEGLPHPRYEEAIFQSELKTKPTIPLSGIPFYREPLELKAEDVDALRNVLAYGGTYRSFSGEKKCGGFHPDFAVEWSLPAGTSRCLICFGCSEIRFDDASERGVFYDLRSEGKGQNGTKGLLELLRPYRKNRPPHERFGTGPPAL